MDEAGDRTHYFAYGSNMSLRQMERRCPGFTVVGRGRVAGYRLVFPRRCASWEQGGVAGIEPAEGHRVEGVVYLLADAHVAALDGYEGIQEGEYTRAEVRVILADRRSVTAMTYAATPQKGGPPPPGSRYLATLLEGARDHGLPAVWRDHLRSFAADTGAETAT